MTASELSRKLLYCGYSDIIYYLKDSPLNGYFRQQINSIIRQKEINATLLDIFNEIYYQCVHINFYEINDNDTIEKYFKESEEWLHSKTASQLVFSVVWAFISSKKRTFNEDRVFIKIGKYISQGVLLSFAIRIKEHIKTLRIGIPEIFPTKSVPINYLNKIFPGSVSEIFLKNELELFSPNEQYQRYCDIWSKVTYNYTFSVIEKLIDLYTTEESQSRLLLFIRYSIPFLSQEQNFFFTELYARINRSHNISDIVNILRCEIALTKDFNHTSRPLVSTVEQTDRDKLQDELAHTKEERDILKTELEKLKAQNSVLEEDIRKLQASYEIERARQAAIYRATQIPDKDDRMTAQDKRPYLLLTDMVAYVKEKYSMSSAKEFITMCYRLFIRNDKMIDEDTATLLDGIEEDIRSREANHQTIEIPYASQVNINPQSVNNDSK